MNQSGGCTTLRCTLHQYCTTISIKLIECGEVLGLMSYCVTVCVFHFEDPIEIVSDGWKDGVNLKHTSKASK